MRNLATRHKFAFAVGRQREIRDWDEMTKDVIFSSRPYVLVYRGLSAYTNRIRV